MKQDLAEALFKGAQSNAIAGMVIDDAIELRLGYLLQLEDLVLLLLQTLKGVAHVTSLRLDDDL